MKKYIRTASKLFNYQGKMLRAEEGESKVDTINRYKAMWAKEAKDATESTRQSNQKRADYRRTPKYHEGTVVLTKDGDYYKVFEPYYDETLDDVAYTGYPCDENGTLILDFLVDGNIEEEIYQSEIQKKVRE